MAIGLPLMILLARVLGKEQFGVYSYVISYVSLFTYITTLGVGGIAVRDIVKNPKCENEIIGTAFVLRIIGGIVAFALSVFIILAMNADDRNIVFLVTVLSVSLLFSSLETISYHFEAHVQSKYVAISKSVALIISAFFVVAFSIYNATATSFIYIKLAELLLVGLALIAVYIYKKQSIINWKFKFIRAKKLLSQSWPLLFSGLTAIVYLKIDQIMIGEMIGHSEVGTYAVAARLSEVWYFIPLIIASSFFPSLIKIKEKSVANYKMKIQQLYDNMFLLAFCISLPVSISSEYLVAFLFGSEYSDAGIILSIHVWGAVFVFMRAILSKWLIIEELFFYSLVTHGVGAVFNIMLNLLLIPEYKGVGAAVSTVISYMIASYLSLFISRKTIPAAKMMTKAFFWPIRVCAGK